jgi:divalent metal cation (Fe/Co/Zn/Cd) transporter
MAVFLMIADVLDMANKAGTMPMQVLMLVGIIVLGLVLKSFYNENKKMVSDLVGRLDKKEESMTKERVDRINMLMNLIRDDVAVKQTISDSQRQFSHAIDKNTEAIEELKDVIKDRVTKTP